LEDLRVVLEGRRLGEIDDISRTVIDAADRSVPIANLLHQLGAGASTRISEFFASKPELSETCLLIIVAMLGGCPLTSVRKNAKVLEQLVRATVVLDKKPKKEDYLLSRETLLHKIMAIEEAGVIETDIGPVPSRVVRMETRWLARAVLDWVWYEYDLLRAPLLSWLRGAGSDQDPAVRFRAAATAGYLAHLDFVPVTEQLLRPWAKGDTLSARSAAEALGQASVIEDTSPIGLSLIRLWCLSDDYDLWWTAAAALGGSLGAALPSTAMEYFAWLVHTKDWRAPWIVIDSISRVISSTDEPVECARHIFAHLVQWTSTSGPRQETAVVAFAELWRRAADPDLPTSSACALAIFSAATLDSSITLTRRALRSRIAQDSLLNSMRRIVGAIDGDESARGDLERLISGVAASPDASPDDRDRLSHHLKIWAEGPQPSRAARIIASNLGWS
jgi:hypothetical protein